HVCPCRPWPCPPPSPFPWDPILPPSKGCEHGPSWLLGSELHAEHPLLQLPQPVACRSRVLELEVPGVLQHLLLERLDLARDLLFAHRLVTRLLLRDARLVRVVDAVDQVLDALRHAHRGDAMTLVVDDL